MSKLLKGIAGVCVALFSAYFFLIDGIIKTQLERAGAHALQAPLDIGNVTFHLLPTSLILRDVRVGNAQLSTHNLVQAEEISLPLSLRDLLAHKLIVESVDVHGLHFNRPRDQHSDIAASSTPSATNSPQLREALQRAQQMLNHPLASNTLDSNASITGAMLADQFKPLLTQITTALHTLATFSSDMGDWQILLRRIDIDGALDFPGANSTRNHSALRFTGGVDNATPQPQLFDAVTQFDFRNAETEAATLRISGNLDKRKLAQATLRFDLNNFALTHWPLSTDPELKIIVVSANANIQALLTLTGNQFDLNALAHFQQASFNVATGDNNVARTVADVWRRTDAFDINLQANGDLQNPVLKLNSSLDAALAAALRQIQSQQLQPASAFPQAAPFPNSP